ncbi:hypothetical protein VFPFJ_03532 [Purpureocillium lilacinum]|uniref:Uncharacterized protein n=1 Tax=Purpureocillium lilacinum TaxID=33203 RepID=A0A179HPL7_PURLI|nr:hypothetical protein VFPFJ_03532 [Purpureocillium lilacinum]OAQ91792.1 hypothetical protein VFPFJ_03532 [Purpureocillium lilacinum]
MDDLDVVWRVSALRNLQPNAVVELAPWSTARRRLANRIAEWFGARPGAALTSLVSCIDDDDDDGGRGMSMPRERSGASVSQTHSLS